jgi:hypothetical protein
VDDLPIRISIAVALALLALLAGLRRRRVSRASAASSAAAGARPPLSPRAGERRAALFADLPPDVLVARMRVEPGPLADAVAVLREGRSAEAKRMLEHPDTELGWSAWPEYGWALAAARLGVGSPERALLAARQALAIPGLEARATAQAWSVLREFGELPPSDAAGQLLGVVVETGMEHGFATLAAYADGEAELVPGDGGGAAGPVRHPDVRAAALRLVQATEAASGVFGASSGSHPPPSPGRIRFTLLTPAGPRAAEIQPAGHALNPVYEAMRRLLKVLREHTREVARVSVSRDDAILLNGRPTTLDALRADLGRLRASGGAVWFHRPNPHRNPTPAAHAVFAAIIEHHLPVTLSESDPVNGEPAPEPAYASDPA